MREVTRRVELRACGDRGCTAEKISDGRTNEAAQEKGRPEGRLPGVGARRRVLLMRSVSRLWNGW